MDHEGYCEVNVELARKTWEPDDRITAQSMIDWGKNPATTTFVTANHTKREFTSTTTEPEGEPC